LKRGAPVSLIRADHESKEKVNDRFRGLAALTLQRGWAPVKMACWIHGGLLTERDLQDIRAQLEGFDSISAITPEMRDVIETEWPDLAAKLLPPKDVR
jgi:hypothetical protein